MHAERLIKSAEAFPVSAETAASGVNPRLCRLVEAEIKTRVRIDSIEGAPSYMAKLKQYGIFPGDLARVVRIAPFGGPILLDVRGMEIALGKSLAACVWVEVVGCDLP